MSAELQTLVADAERAGAIAADECVPPVMIVEGYEDQPVLDGPCGFAWISVRPGNSPLANFLKKSGKGGRDSYAGGVSVWVHAYRQSMAKKAAYADAYAAKIRDADLPRVTAYGQSRID